MDGSEMCIEDTGTWILWAGQIPHAIVLQYTRCLSSHCTDRDSLKVVVQELGSGAESLDVLQRLQWMLLAHVRRKA